MTNWLYNKKLNLSKVCPKFLKRSSKQFICKIQICITRVTVLLQLFCLHTLTGSNLSVRVIIFSEQRTMYLVYAKYYRRL